MRAKIVAGNWKMNKNSEETEDLINELIDKLPTDLEAEVIIAPTFVNLASAVDHTEFTNIDYKSLLKKESVLYDVKGFLNDDIVDGKL